MHQNLGCLLKSGRFQDCKYKKKKKKINSYCCLPPLKAKVIWIWVLLQMQQKCTKLNCTPKIVTKKFIFIQTCTKSCQKLSSVSKPRKCFS